MLYDLSYPSTPNGNDTYYEMALKTSVPIFLTAWPRGNVTFSWIADVRSVCLTPAAGVEAGSETATSGAVDSRPGMGPLSMTWAFVILLTFGFLL